MADWGELRMHGTQLSGASAHSGGAIALCKNSSASLVNVSIVNATAEEGDMEGAGIALRNNARVAITNSTISGCSCDGCSGSAISAVNNSTVALDGVRLVNNFGSYGSGLGLWNNASLVLSGRASEALNNTATNCGAGLALSSRGFTMESVRRFFVAANNSAAYAADVCISVHKVEVVSTDGDLENFVVSTANNGGVLSVLVNVSGPLGLPADDPLQIFVYNELNATVAKQIVHRQGSGQEEEDAQGLRRVKLKLRHPPGERVRRVKGCCFIGPAVCGMPTPLRHLNHPIHLLPCPHHFNSVEGEVTESFNVFVCLLSDCVAAQQAFTGWSLVCLMKMPVLNQQSCKCALSPAPLAT